MEFAFKNDEADEAETGLEDRCERLNEATTRAAQAGHKALFEAIGSDEAIPDNCDKVLASTAAMLSIFKGMVESAAKREHQLPRRLILLILERDLAPALAALYEAEANSA